MKQAPQDIRPTSYRETYRRHRKLFYVPVVLGAVAAAVILFSSSTSYRSTASLWVDTAPPVASSVGANGSPSLAEPPASAEQGILAELLTTDSFADAVAAHSLLGKELGSPAAIRAKAPSLVEHKQVSAAATGGQVLNVSYTGSSPAVAESVLGAIVTQLRDYNNRLATQHQAATVAYDRQQVKLDQTALNTANSNFHAYMAQHPNASRTDPTYLSLTAAQNYAVTQLGQATSTLNQTTASPDANGWNIGVLDSPGRAVSRAPDKKKTLAVILGGAFGGLLVSLLAVVALTPAKKEEREDELPTGSDDSPGGPFSGPSTVPAEWSENRPLVDAVQRLSSFGMLSEQMNEQ